MYRTSPDCNLFFRLSSVLCSGLQRRCRRVNGGARLVLPAGKTWALPGTSLLEFRWEVFNLLNRANLDLPNRNLRQPEFERRIFSAKNPREMQFGLRLAF